MDCMEGMKQFPDNYFDLAIVDPPYGIEINTQFSKSNKIGTKSMFKQTKGIGVKEWDNNIPTDKYFNELFRTSKNQIIWGGNYFLTHLYATKCLLIWDKMNGTNNMADAEVAWTSLINSTLRMFRMHHFSSGYNKKIHITQKPVALYKWILHNYAKPDFKIIDTHAGSCSSVIAFLDYGCDWIAFEIDKDYYEAASKRIENHKMQLKLAI